MFFGLPKEPKRILLFKIGAIGDVMMTTPLLRALKKRFPECQLEYLVGKWSSAVLENNPNLTDIITFEDEIVFKENILELLKLARQIRKRRYNLVLVLDPSYQAGMYARLFGAPTLGFARGHEGIVHTASVPYENQKHDIEYYLSLAQKLGCEEISTKLEIFPTQEEKKMRIKKSKKKVIGLCPGGARNPGMSMHLKRWPYFTQLAQKLSKEYDLVVFGAQSDKECLNGFPKTFQSFVGKTNLREMGVLMSQCDLIITNDSGPMHIASACAPKVIALFGPTDPLKLRPLGKHRVTLHKKETQCPPCNPSQRPPCYLDGRFPDCPTHACMKELSVDEVMKTIQSTLR